MNTYLSKKDVQNGQQTNEKMLNITHHQGNQNRSEIPPHTVRMGKIKNTNSQVLVRMWRKRNLVICWLELTYDPVIALFTQRVRKQ